jgi:anti-sigma-K factor RskA
MNIESYIRSGFLESYALGQGTPAERAEVERMVAQYPAVAAELKAIEDSLAAYAQAHAVVAPAGLKEQILARISEEQTSPESQSSEDTTDRPGFNWGRLLTILSLAAAAAMGFLFWQAKSTENTLNSEVVSLTEKLKNCEENSATQAKIKQNIAFLSDPDTRRVDLKDEQGRQVTVQYNTKRQSAVMNTAQLPALAADQDYQLWIIVKDNPNPIPLEVFRPGTDPQDLIPVTFREQAVAYAVSIEPRGGTQTGKPTTVILLGQLG